MKRMLNQKLSMAVTCWFLIIGMVLTASPAFSRERSSSQDRDRTYNNDRSRDRDSTYNSDRTRDRDRNYDNDRSRDRDGYRDWNRSYERKKSKTVRVVHVYRSNPLPAIVATGIVAGITFSLLDRNNAPAYQVTTPAPCPAAINRTGVQGAVVVTVALLNLRSGPGLGKPCVGKIHRGARLSIMGTSAGWYYVRTSGNVSGWVMAQYTTPAFGG